MDWRLGAVAHAAESGAAALDGYAGRNTVDKPTSSGGIGLFRDAGFHETPSGSTYYTVMRRLLTPTSEPEPTV